MKEKYVITKDFFGYYMTTKENYYNRIRNEQRVTRLSDFDSYDEIVEWMIKNNYTDSLDNIEIITTPF